MPTRYRKVSTMIWNDEKFRSLPDRSQLVFLFTMTHPHMTSLGAMRASIEGLCAEHGKWSAEAFREAFAEVSAKGMASLDEGACCIVLPNFLKHNPPESPNVVKSWEKQLELIPECKLKLELVQRVREFIESLSEAFSKALPKAFANPEPEPEPELELELEKGEAAPRISLQEVLSAWNQHMGQKCRVTQSRERSLRARAKDDDWVAGWPSALKKAQESSFCQGDNERGWRASLDWFLKPDSVLKILEGAYDNRNGNSRGSNRPLSVGEGVRFAG